MEKEEAFAQRQVWIRPMQKKDCKLVEQLEQQCFSVPWTLQSLEDALQYENYQFLTAWLDEELIGYMGMILAADEADITNVAVVPKMRGRGIGYQLVKESLGQVAVKGVTQIFLEVRQSNEKAIHLYEKCGFYQVSIRKNYYQVPVENGIIMSVNLTTMK